MIAGSVGGNMIIIMQTNATENQINHVIKKIEESGLKAHLSRGAEKTIIGAVGNERVLHIDQLKAIDGVENVLPILKPYKLASREFKKENSIIKVNGVEIGGNKIVVMAGPCAVENEEQILTAAKAVKAAGASVLRASAFKPRTSPYDFQGLGEEGLKLLKKAKQLTGLVTETEVMDIRNVDLVAEYVDILRVGARNMQNFDLLKEVGRRNKPVILKRGMSATIKEFLLAAEYIMSEGNHNVILCERGIRTFETATRNTLDLNAVALLKEETHLPVIVDPSHGTGKWSLVIPLSMAAIAAGADGLIVEVHPNPEMALSDGDQSLKTAKFAELMKEIRLVAKAVGRSV